jgi:hypothetical protein
MRILKEFTQEPVSPDDPVAKGSVFSVLGQGHNTISSSRIGALTSGN